MPSTVLRMDLDPNRETFDRERAEFDLLENGSLVVRLEDERNKMSVTLPADELAQLRDFLVMELGLGCNLAAGYNPACWNGAAKIDTKG